MLFDRIQDRSENITRFLVIGRQEPGPTGNDRTTIQFQTDHKPGALVDVLADFRDAGVNLAHIDKRPSRLDNWNYTFFVDLEGHREDPVVRDAIVTDAVKDDLSDVLRGAAPRLLPDAEVRPPPQSQVVAPPALVRTATSAPARAGPPIASWISFGVGAAALASAACRRASVGVGVVVPAF